MKHGGLHGRPGTNDSSRNAGERPANRLRTAIQRRAFHAARRLYIARIPRARRKRTIFPQRMALRGPRKFALQPCRATISPQHIDPASPIVVLRDEKLELKARFRTSACIACRCCSKGAAMYAPDRLPISRMELHTRRRAARCANDGSSKRAFCKEKLCVCRPCDARSGKAGSTSRSMPNAPPVAGKFAGLTRTDCQLRRGRLHRKRSTKSTSGIPTGRSSLKTSWRVITCPCCIAQP
jgi:hypothetical protein